MSYEFKDAAGRVWKIGVTVAIARAVNDEAKLSIYSLPQKKFDGLFELINDPFRLVEVAWVMCRASHPDVTREQFEESLDGPAIERLVDAVLEAIPDFFSDTPGREHLRATLARAKRVKERTQARLKQEADKFDPEKINVDRLAAKIMAENPMPASLRELFGDSPASAESTPAPSPTPS